MANIKINDVFQRVQYYATAGQTQFTVPFPFFQDQYVYVWLNGEQLQIGLAPGQYTISGAGSTSGGLVTLVTPAIEDDIITIQGVMPIDRTSIYSATISNLTGTDLNADFNREVVMMKQIETAQALLQLQYAPWELISQDVDDTTDRYIPLLPPNHTWMMNAAGTKITTAGIPDGGIAPANVPVVTWTATTDLTNAFNLAALTSGILKQSVASGAADIQIAQSGVDYWQPGQMMTIPNNPTIDNQVANKGYVDLIAAGFNLLNPVYAASTTDINATYNNGAAGIGATLTANANGVLSLDGVNPPIGQNILIKDQASELTNGIYTVTNAGSVSTPFVLTRATTFDAPDEIQQGDLVNILQGSSQKYSMWLQVAAVNSVGVDPIQFVLFAQSNPNYVTLTTNQTISGNKDFTGIVTVPTPTSNTQSANKIYVDTAVANTIKSVVVRTFSSSGTYVPTSGMLYCDIDEVGAGGAGGGTVATTALGQCAAGGGGGSGARSKGRFTAAQIGASQSIIIGNGGTGVAGASGNNGSSTSVGTLITASGGIGGLVSNVITTGSIGVLGGAGGNATTGNDINTPGNAGSPSAIYASANNAAIGGGGAPSVLGGGTQSVRALSSVSNGLSAAANTGAGGSGAAVGNIVSAAATGGNGGSGKITITEYVA